MTALASGAVYAVNTFVGNAARAATEMRNFGEETGFALEGLQKWMAVMPQVNPAITAERAAASYRALANAMTDVTLQGGGGPFAMLGAGDDVRLLDPQEVLERIRENLDASIERWGGIDKVYALLSRIGAQDLLLGLKQTGEAFDELASSAMLSEGDIERLAQLDRTLAKIALTFEMFRKKVSADWSESVAQMFTNLSVAVLKTADAFNKMGQWFNNLSSDQKTLIGFFAALLGLVTALVVPFAGLAAGAVALVLALNDLGAFLSGNDSFLGKIMKPLNLIWNIVRLILLGLSMIPGAVSGDLAALNEWARRQKEESAGKGGLFTGAEADASKFFGEMGDKLRRIINPQLPEYETAPASVVRMNNAQQGQSSNATNFNNNYNINSTGDPYSIAEEITFMQQRQFNLGLNNFNNGARY
jgi:hypothetical protein